MKTIDELWRLLNEAQRMPYGAAQIALVEQVMRHSDAAGDRELSFAVRMVATSAFRYGGEEAKSFVSFSWCLSDFDRNPAPFHARHTHDLLWHFKWMTNGLTSFPEVPLERTYRVLDDMERRYREGGHSLQAVYGSRYEVAQHVGDVDAARSYYDLWSTTPRDELSDCAGCDPTTQVDHLADRSEFAEAIAVAEPVLAGRLNCAAQPQSILRSLMIPYVRAGRPDDAADAHRRAYRLDRNRTGNLWSIGDHIGFCARTGNDARGLEILERHLGGLDEPSSPADAMNFAASAVRLLRGLVASGHGDTTVHRPAYGDRAAADVPVRALEAELATMVAGLAARFDARNGTIVQSTRMAERMDAEPLTDGLPLSPSARRHPPVTPPPTVSAAVPVVPVPTETIEVPADADPLTLLDLADAHDRNDADDARDAVLAQFDARFGDTELTPGLAGRRADLRGGQLWDSADPQPSLDQWWRAATLLAESGDEAAASAAVGRAGLAMVVQGDDPDEGFGLIDQDVATQERVGDPRRLAASLSRRAMAFMARGQFDDSLAAQTRAGEVAATVGEPRLDAVHALRRAQNLAVLDRLEESAEIAGQARDFYRQHGPRSRFVTAALVVGRAAATPAEGLAAFEEALSVADASTVLEARLGRGRARYALESWTEAIDDFVEVVALCAERDLPEAGAFIRGELAAAYHRAGRLVEAAEVAEESIPVLDRLGHDDAADQARFRLAGIYRDLGTPDPALALYDELVERLGKVDNDAGRGQMHENAGEVLYKADRDASAAQRFAEAAQAYRAAGLGLDELRVLRRRVASLHWADDIEAGAEAARQGVSRYDELRVQDESAAAVWERAMLGFEAGRMFVARDRFAEALPFVTGQPELLRGIEAPEEAAAVAQVLAGALQGLGRDDEAEAVRAEWGVEDDD
jgi:tetratricopeptide (TPR) repeat protein